MKGMKRKFFLKRMWNFVVVMLIPALLLVAVTTYMTFVTQMHRMMQDNERGIEAVRSNISLVLDSVLAQNSYMTGMTRTNMVLNKALKRESLSYTDAIYLRSLVSSLNSMTNAYDYVDSVLIYMDGYDRALTSSGLVNLSADDYSGWYSVYSSMSDAERTCIAPVVVNAGKASERRQLVVCARMLTMEGCVAVTLNISHLQEMIAVLRPSDNQHLYLVDGSGRLLAKAGDAGATEELQNLMGKTLSGAGNTAEQEHEFWIKLDDRDCLLNWQSYQNPDFYIVSTIDRAMILENLGERLMPLLLMAVVALYAIVFLAYVNTKRSFDEINLMLQMFEDAEAGRTIRRPQRKVNDEYDVIMDKFLSIACAVLLSFMTILVLIQVFSRYVLNSPVAFTEELVRYSLIWTGFIGAAYAFSTREHMSLTLVRDKFTGKAHTALLVAIDSLILLLAIFVITIGGFKLAVSASREFSALLGIPRSLVYSIAPISGIFIVIAQIINIYEDITGEKVDC